MIQDKKKYGALQCVDGIEKAVLQKQMESLDAILLSMKETMYAFFLLLLCDHNQKKNCMFHVQLVSSISCLPFGFSLLP